MNDEHTKKVSYCGNCGQEGHSYRRCLAPIMSLGVILFKINKESLSLDPENSIKYLLVQRRDTLGYVEFMRGKYNLENYRYIYELFKIMTEGERIKILNNDFDILWQNLWMNKNLKKFNNEYTNSKKKFNILKAGAELDNEFISLLKIHQNTNICWKKPEWGFPKGRRNLRESDKDCAMREFQEESGYKKEDYNILDDEEPIEELFSGTNNIRYKHIYYLGESLREIDLTIDKDNFNQVSEISKIKWFNFTDAYESIRYYNEEKRAVLKKVHEKLLKKYC